MIGFLIERVPTYNFYSSGEQVLAAPDATTPNILGSVGDEFFNAVFGNNPGGQKSWSLQEKLKGRAITGEILGSNYGGWGFNVNWYEPGGQNPARRKTPAEAADITDLQLVQEPFFIPGPSQLHTGDSASAYANGHQNTLLAEMIPALTRPAGGNRISSEIFAPPNGPDRNFDLTSPTFRNGWPQERLVEDSKRDRWLHSDVSEVAYPFTCKLFIRLKELGGLDK